MTHNTVSLQVSLPQMLDLALGTPEVINFIIIQNITKNLSKISTIGRIY